MAKNQHPELPFILAANRDEFYHRPTRQASFWPEQPSVLAGKDLQAGGSWLGVTRAGRFAALTNIRRQEQTQTPLQSRGQIITTCLSSSDLNEGLQDIAQKRDYFAGFNLLAGHLLGETVYLNSQKNPQPLANGLYGLSNAELDSPWPKLKFGKQNLARLLEQKFKIDDWFALLASRQNFAEQSLPDTGVGLHLEKTLAPIFIQSPNYGTRASTIITADKQGNVHFFERSFNEQGLVTKNQTFQWNLHDDF